MSYTELHTGKLRPLVIEMSIEEFINWVETKEGFEIEDLEYLLEEEYQFFQVRDKNKKYKESMYIKYVYNKGTLYEVIEHSGEREAGFLDITTKNEDGTVSFTYLFYNGGTCFSELLEEGLDKIEKQ